MWLLVIRKYRRRNSIPHETRESFSVRSWRSRWSLLARRSGEHDHRERCRLHADGEARDDVRGVSGLRRRGDRLHRSPASAGVVLRDRNEQKRHDEADKRRRVEVREAELAAVLGVGQLEVERERGFEVGEGLERARRNAFDPPGSVIRP